MLVLLGGLIQHFSGRSRAAKCWSQTAEVVASLMRRKVIAITVWNIFSAAIQVGKQFAGSECNTCTVTGMVKSRLSNKKMNELPPVACNSLFNIT